MELKDKLKLARKNAYLSQEDLASLLNVLPSTVFNWENGLETPDINSFIQLSRMLDISLNYLLNASTTNIKKR